jgi:uncharacterized protein YqeY
VAISDQGLRADLKNAMLAKDRVRTSVLRALIAAAKNRAIERKEPTLDETELIAIVRREIKQRNETMEFARKAGRDETVAELTQELAVLDGYLPKQLGEEELRAAITTIVSDCGATSIGPVMKELSSRYPGRYDGKLASRLAQEMVSK